MIIIGTILVIASFIFLPMVFGPYGVIVPLCVLAGMVFSTYVRTRYIYEDIERIKQKLGIPDDDPPLDRQNGVLKDEEIERLLEDEEITGKNG